MTKLGNESEIHNDSILLFPPIDKQEISPSHLMSLLKSSSLICHEKEQERKREEICTKKDLAGGFKEFKLVRLIFPEDRRLPRSFNDRVSHINKTDKSNNNNKMPNSRNHSSSEITVEQKINALDNSSGNNANFPNPLMSVNNVYNFDAHPLSKNTILIAGDSFPHVLYHLKYFSNPYRLDRNSNGGGILVYIRDNIPSKLVKLDQKFENFKGFFY